MAWDDPEDELEQWQQAVDDFAGLKKPGKLSLWQQLMRSQLSKRILVPTTQPAPAGGFAGFTGPVALCEMRTTMPLSIDITINVPNLQTVDIAGGGVFVTWGSTKGAVQVAEIDIGRGWRHPFYASYLRVDYIAERDNVALPGNQAADLELTATITPASGAPSMPLQCSRFFTATLGTGAVSVRNIPAFAKEVRLSASPGGNFPFIDAEILFSMGNAAGTSIFRQQIENNAMAGNPSWLMNQKRWPVPQRAATYRFQNFSMQPLSAATAIADLAL